LNAVLTRHELDVAQFPNLEREPGVYGIEPFLLRADADARIPAPKESPAVLLVSYALLLSAVAKGSTWQLQALGLGPDGKERQQAWLLATPPPKGDNRRRATPDTSAKPDPGAVDRGLFWVDLGPPLLAQALRPGDKLTLRLGAVEASITLPAARR
jgi:hypothetical protein